MGSRESKWRGSQEPRVSAGREVWDVTGESRNQKDGKDKYGACVNKEEE